MSIPWGIIAISLLLVFTAIVLGVTFNSISRDIFHPLILINAFFAYFVIAPAALLIKTHNFTYPIAKNQPDKLISLSLLVFMAGYCVLVATFYLMKTPTPLEKKVFSLTNMIRQSRKAVLLGGLFFMTTGLLCFAYYTFVNGGPMRLLTVQPRTAFAQVENTGRYRVIGLTGLFSGFVLIATALEDVTIINRFTSQNQDQTQWEYVLFFVSFLTILTIAVLTRERLLIALPVAYLILHTHSNNSIPDRYLIGIGIGAALPMILFSFIESFILRSGNLALLIAGLLNTVRFEVFVGVISHVPSDYPYQYGSTLVGAIPLPFEWSWIPLSNGDQLEVIIFGKNRTFTTLSSTLFGEFYLNFGILGVLIGSAICGAFLNICYRIHDTNQSGLTNGLYPAALLTILLALPTGVRWATKGLVFRLWPGVIITIVGIYLYNRYYPGNRSISSTS